MRLVVFSNAVIKMLSFQYSIVGLVCLFSCVICMRLHGSSGKTLYIAEDTANTGGKPIVINRYDDDENPLLERRKRDAAIQTPTEQKNISIWTSQLKDSHQQLIVNWVGNGSNVIICLARDSSPRKGILAPSALFISYDYGKNFTNKTESFRLDSETDSGYAQLDKFFNHPKYPEFCVFVDSTNMKLYYTSDNGRNIHRSDLTFSPTELAFDEEFPDKYVILDKVDSNGNLYLTLDGGKTFKMIQSFVKTFSWSSGPGYLKVFYVERWNPDGTSTVFSASDPTDLMNAEVLFEEAKDFQIKGDFMFATKQNKEKSTLHLYISHQRGPFYKAKFQTELDLRKFQIADVTDNRIFVSAMHTESLANLYVSKIGMNFTQYNFVLSMEQILCYFPHGNWRNSWLEIVTEDPFTDLYRVEGLKGIYIASKVDSKAPGPSIRPEHLISLITFDHGVTWSPIKPPTEDEEGNPLSCHIEDSCSLHLCQKFSQLYPLTRSASILSSKSAPGIIIAAGVMGKSLKGIPGVYMSRDAGLTWKRILKDDYLFNYGDHGGVLVVVKSIISHGKTRRILYSTNEGIEWNSYQFNTDDLRIYGLLTEPGENTTTFTVLGSAKNQHQWIIITIDLKNTFNRNCNADDYKFWYPSPPNSSVSCVLGTRNIFQRRLAHTKCYNGIDYQPSVKQEVCECTRRDFECDFGFMLLDEECIQNKSVKFDPYSIPSDCKPGEYYKLTKGYRKIDGNTCTISGYMAYAPDNIPCPIEKPTEFMLVALRDKIARIDLSDYSAMYPVEGQNNIVAIEYDLKANCIYWADIESDKIMRQCFGSGTPQEVIVDTDLASIEGMALDWVSNVLFFVDGLRKKIEAVRTDLTSQGRMRVTILNDTHLSKPKGIAVHPKAGYLFWTDWDRSTPSVSRSRLDGTEVKKLFGDPIVRCPNGITIDQISERIYWADTTENYIASSDLEGRYFRKILWNEEKIEVSPFAVAVLKDKMYWYDWKEKSIFLADKDTGAKVITNIDSFSGLTNLKVYGHAVQYGRNACSYKNTSCDNALCLGIPNNIFSCLCPDGLRKSNGKCVCPDGVEPLTNMTCPKSVDVTCDEKDCPHYCNETQFSCGNGKCIESSSVCDGDSDCPNGADEKEDICKKSNCAPYMFSCPSGKCIYQNWVCDGYNDCNDGSDERNCTPQVQVKQPNVTNCTGNTFACGNDTGLCVPQAWVCDGDSDCPNGADEQQDTCNNSTCAPYMFTCPSGKCIYKGWVCDGDKDCNDGSDERNCTPQVQVKKPNVMNCTGNTFACNNETGLCLPPSWVCDGDKDCPNGLDEHEDTCKNSTCARHMFHCLSGKCIFHSRVCDGHNDCNDGSDELNCRVVKKPENVSCTGFSCGDPTDHCLPHLWVCDGDVDCPNGADELEEYCKNTVCAPYMFRCPSGKCIFKDDVCNGKNNCGDKEASDEQNCPDKVSHDPDEEDCFQWMFPCDNNRCIPLWWRCDGDDNCGDNSDEIGCDLVTPKPEAVIPEPMLSTPPEAEAVIPESTLSKLPEAAAVIPESTLSKPPDPEAVIPEPTLSKPPEPEAVFPEPTLSLQKCKKNQFTCSSGLCIPLAWMCNGSEDCADGSDELHCGTQLLNIEVDQTSINSTSFLVSCRLEEQKMAQYSFLPSISEVDDEKWINLSWTNDSLYRFTNLKPFTNYNVTFYIRDSKSNRTYASNKYVNTTTRQGVPSPPVKLSVRQLNDDAVQVLWERPASPNGVIQYYKLYYSPPYPWNMELYRANDNYMKSVIVNAHFAQNIEYSFWVMAVNDLYTSNSSEVVYLTLGIGGDADEADELSNVNMWRINASAVYLEWHKVRGVEGYRVQVRLPMKYAKPPPLNTTNNNITVTNLPPGVDLFIDVVAFNNSMFGSPITIPLKTEGEPDVVLNISATVLRKTPTAVKLQWSPPVGKRYHNKDLEYEVHYTNLNRTNPDEISNDTKILVKDTSIIFDDLNSCELHEFTVGLLNGPLAPHLKIITREKSNCEGGASNPGSASSAGGTGTSAGDSADGGGVGLAGGASGVGGAGSAGSAGGSGGDGGEGHSAGGVGGTGASAGGARVTGGAGDAGDASDPVGPGTAGGAGGAGRAGGAAVDGGVAALSVY